MNNMQPNPFAEDDMTIPRALIELADEKGFEIYVASCEDCDQLHYNVANAGGGLELLELDALLLALPNIHEVLKGQW